jgi:hypothetical protein
MRQSLYTVATAAAHAACNGNLQAASLQPFVQHVDFHVIAAVVSRRSTAVDGILWLLYLNRQHTSGRPEQAHLVIFILVVPA